MHSFTVVLPVYCNNDASQFEAAIESLLAQTLLPDELLIVVDGSIPVCIEQEIENVKSIIRIRGFSIEVNILKLQERQGLGEAMRRAIKVAKGDFVARMDADDICLPDRFEKQMKCFEENPELSVVGAQIAEFDGDIENITGRRVVPLGHDDIVSYMKSRNGMNHVTTIMKKNDVIAAGNYQPMEWFEDYYLWVRMLHQGYKFKNIEDDVVLVRAGKSQIDRRGGWNYFKNEYHLFNYLYTESFISLGRYILNLMERGTVRLLMPLKVREWFYHIFLR